MNLRSRLDAIEERLPAPLPAPAGVPEWVWEHARTTAPVSGERIVQEHLEEIAARPQAIQALLLMHTPWEEYEATLKPLWEAAVKRDRS